MRTLTFANALNEALRQEMRVNPKIFIAGEDVGLYGGIYGVTAGLFAEFGEDRVKDTPISESAIIGMAVGSAPWAWCRWWSSCSWISSASAWISS